MVVHLGTPGVAEPQHTQESYEARANLDWEKAHSRGPNEPIEGPVEPCWVGVRYRESECNEALHQRNSEATTAIDAQRRPYLGGDDLEPEHPPSPFSKPGSGLWPPKHR